MIYRRWYQLLALLLVVSCNKAPPAEPATYHWVLTAAPGGPRSGRLIVDGKDTGSIVEGTGSVVLSKNEWLGERQLGIRVDTTCGPEELKIDVSLSREVEMQYRKQSSAVTGTRVYFKAESKPTAIVYLDAGARGPTSVTLGKQTVNVTGSQKVVSTVGQCEEARKISVGGQVIGEFSPPGTATLVDVVGGQCTRLAPIHYGAPGAPSVRGADGTKILKGRRTYEVPLEITYFFTPPPATIESGNDLMTTLWSLRRCN